MAINSASKSIFNKLWILLSLLLFTLILDIRRVHGHVALTFPPARKYDLDFLDNSRTKGPCGMPKGDPPLAGVVVPCVVVEVVGLVGVVEVGAGGGFQIQLLDELERPVLDLTPSVNGSKFVSTDATTQQYQVRLPSDYVCQNCSIRLLRQANEWVDWYRFWSCADVDIVQRKDYKETCSGHGKYFPGRCKCDKYYYGDRCQYRDECVTDQDCGAHGKCINLDGTSLPRRQCYCNFGWFGPGCNKKSPIKSLDDLDYSLYQTKELSEDFRIYWRVLKEQKELEVIMKVNGTSWVGLGWRPRDLTAECRNFPRIRDLWDKDNDDVQSTIPKSESEPTSEPEPSGEKISEAEPSSEPESEPKSEPEPQLKTPSVVSSKSKRVATNEETTNKEGITLSTNPTPEPIAKSQVNSETGTSTPEPEPESSAEPEPESASAEPEPESASAEPEPESASAEPEPESSAEPEPESSAEPEPESASAEPEPESASAEPEPESASAEPEPKSEPEAESEPKSTPEPEISAPQSEPNSKSEPISRPGSVSLGLGAGKPKLNKWTPTQDFKGMDCTDIIIGSVRGNASRILDYYTRDRSTPRTDDFWGGKFDLTAATGLERDGVTTIAFRRKLEAHEPSDHAIVDDFMSVIWARGQEPGRYVHSPLSGLETEMASVPEFYKQDELKYHGGKMQRGLASINFLSMPKKEQSAKKSSQLLDNDCWGHWRYPYNCSPENNTCEYYARWETIGRGDEMRFHIETSHTDTWTGIGFSEDDKMPQTDAIIGWVDKAGRPFLMDMWIVGKQSPILDSPPHRQDIYNTSGRIQNGVTILEFTRKRISDDTHDLSFTDTHCLYLMFPIVGGSFNAVNKKIRRHEQTPIVTDTRVCIKSCGKELENLYNVSPTSAPDRLVYAVGIKLENLAESFEAPQKGSPEFDNLANTIRTSFNSILEEIPGYYMTDVKEFEKTSESVVAKMNVLFNKAAYEKGRTLIPEIKNNDLTESEDEMREGKIVKRAISDSLATGKIGSLSVDPNYLDFEPIEYITNREDEKGSSFFQLSETRLYTVLGCILALIIVALLQVTCTIYKTSRKKHNQKDQLIPNSAWKDYSSNTNYAFDAFGEPEEKNGKSRSRTSSSQQTLPMSHSPGKTQYYDNTRNGTNSRPQNGVGGNESRTAIQQQQHLSGYYTQDRRSRQPHYQQSMSSNVDTPDFYFMPSQRKYSGEVVRVYVDYNKEPKN
uniref:Putative drebrin n=1 Tax=Lutzomyia longipalpis TaxID=7200 RepID=A0A1B0CTC1_LUTLO